MPTHAQQSAKAPDFAFPQTVSKNANSDLKKAIKDGDAHQSLNALIRIYLSESIIDPASIPSSISLVENTTKSFQDNQLLPIFDILLARMYYDFYQSDRWIFDAREMPLDPVPDDLNQWSGAQMDRKINQLCLQAISEPRVLIALQTQDYKDIISCTDISLPYFPSLLDFVYSEALTMHQDEGDWAEKALADNIKYNREEGPRIYWALQSAKSQPNFWENGQKLFAQYQSSQLADLVLEELANAVNSPLEEKISYIDDEDSSAQDDNETIARKKLVVNEIDQFLNAHPRCALANNLKNKREDFLTPCASVSMPNLAALDSEFAANVKISNANKCQIKLFYLGKNAPNHRYTKAQDPSITNNEPISVYTIQTPQQPPFEKDSVLNITLEKPGYYVLIPYIDDKPSNNELDFIRCVPASPIVLSSTTNPYLAVVDSHTGMPINAAKVLIVKDKIIKKVGSTNAQGLFPIGEFFQPKEWVNVKIEVRGQIYDFDNLRIYKEAVPDFSLKDDKAIVLTDRALYHPGDEVNFLAIVNNLTVDAAGNCDKRLVADRKVIAYLYDANYEQVDTLIGITDEFGRFSGKFELPTTGLTGNFNICLEQRSPKSCTLASKYFMVSDYKMPDFKLQDIEVQRDTPQKGSVTVTGRAVTYSGMPMADAEIEAILSQSSWWRWMQPARQLSSMQCETDDDGEFSVVFTPEDFGDDSKHFSFYSVELNAVSPSGTTATAYQAFSLGKKYGVSLNLPSKVNALLPLKPEIKLIDANGNAADYPIEWSIYPKDNEKDVTLKGSDISDIDLSSLRPGEYIFKAATADPALADPATQAFQLYNTHTDIVPGSSPLWIEKNRLELVPEGNKLVATLCYGTLADSSSVYYAVHYRDKINVIDMEYADKGYHDLKVELPLDIEEATLSIFTLKDCKLCNYDINLTFTRLTGLKIAAESFRDRLIPGQEETWKFQILDADGLPIPAALALDMYNQALEALRHQNFNIYFQEPYLRNHLNISSQYIRQISNSAIIPWKPLIISDIEDPNFYFYGLYACRNHLFGYNRAMRCYSKADGIVMEDFCDSAPMACMAETSENMLGSSADEGEEVAITGQGAYQPQETEKIPEAALRDSDVPMAIWAPVLTTDAKGNVSYSFTVPNANTTWQLQAIAWSQSMETGHLIRDIIASKPVMVMPNAPRFLRAGDCCTISTLVMNNTDSTAIAKVTMEIIEIATGKALSAKTEEVTLEPQGNQTVSIDVTAASTMPAIGFRVRAVVGEYADGEQNAIPILPSVANLIETEPFYLNPGDTLYSTKLPDGEDTRLILTFTENPVWTVVSALPGLRQRISSDANSAAAALFSAAISCGLIRENPILEEAIQHWLESPNDSTLISMLDRNQDLKQALLNCTPWVQAAQSDTERMANLALIFDSKQTEASIADAFATLEKLQHSDGGWAWGSWCKESSEWVTGNVLAMMAQLRQLGWLPADKPLNEMISRAVNYWDEQQTQRLIKYPKTTGLIYSIVRPIFSDIDIPKAAAQVITNTLNDIKKSWRGYTNPAYKAMAAEALYINGLRENALELMSSITEFGVWSKDQGLRFPSVNALYDYAILLEAYAMILPESKQVDGLRQQLIVRKQGTDWGNAVVTNEVITSILCSGSRWTVPAQGAKLRVANHAILPQSPAERYTGELRADLSKYAGDELTIETTGTGPAYGAVFAQLKQTMADVAASSCADLSIQKVMYVRRGTEWEMPSEALKVGDRVKVQLTITCKRNLEYVTILDERAATLQPVDQLPGWIWSEGVGFYRENRDAFTGLYVDYMAPGTYLLTYEMNVGLAGCYSSGVATIQSQYAPELSAHSAGGILKVNPKDF